MRQMCPGNQDSEDNQANRENMAPVSMLVPSERTMSHTGDHDLNSSPAREGLSGYPIKEERVYAVQTTPDGRRVRIPVVLKVYVNNFGGRYAVISQDKLLCRDSGYINLKHCVIKSSADVEPKNVVNTPRNSLSMSQPSRGRSASPFNFQIVSQKIEGQSLMFTVSTRTELEQWLSVLTDPEDEHRETKIPKVVVGSPIRRCVTGQFSPIKAASPRTGKRMSQNIMPALEEEQ